MSVNESSHPEYLGNALYAVFVNGQIELRANDLEHPTDTVYLERHVFEALVRYGSKHFNLHYHKEKT
jgi:hypothetical protein